MTGVEEVAAGVGLWEAVIVPVGEALGEALVAAAEAKAVEVGNKKIREAVESLGGESTKPYANKWQRIDPDFNDDFYVNHQPVQPLGHLYPLEPGSHAMDVETPRSGTSTAAGESATFINSSETAMVLPSTLTKRSSGVEISTTPGKRTKVRHVKGQTSIAAKTVSSAQTYYDSHLLMPGSSEKRLTRLNLKLGKQLYPDVITPFLENLNGKAVIRMQYAGRCVSHGQTANGSNAQRHNHVQMFRHRLSEGTGFNTQAVLDNDYPSSFRNHILYPRSTQAFYPSGDNTVGSNFSVGSTAWRDIKTNDTYWSPYNLADLEDCSWNLNALKLYPQILNGISGSPVIIPDQVISFLTDNHFRSSFLAYNNSQNTVSTGIQRPSTYRFKAVINKGNITYDFMNKGTGGAKVELVVYRVKKNQKINWATTGTPAMDFVNLSISVPIGQGYLDTCKEKAGTDDLGGRSPLAADIIDNPQFPFLPKLKRTKQMGMPFAEVSRQTFAMPAGSRREMSVDLPGLVYDPVNQSNVGTGADPGAIGNPSVFDEHTYAVFISCCGVVCTDEMTTASVAYNVGDTISRCDVQFYCTYTEHIGACMYKNDHKPIMYSAGTLSDTNQTVGITEVPVTILDQASAIRTPNTINTDAAGTVTGSTDPGINLTHEINSAAN